MSKKGSITVEASLIVPVILIILFLFIYVIFAVHDRAILLMKVDNLLENETAPFLLEGQDIDFRKGLFIYKIKNVETIKNDYFFTINIDAEAMVRLGFVDLLLGGYRSYGIHKMHRIHDYCRERRMLSIVRNESE